jgi:ATP-dependent helicase/nuclease subunit A
MELVAEAFYKLQDAYQQGKARRRLLDFDDLEGGVVELLQNEDIRAKWQSEVSAVLVDEFQDTNARQREIVEALTGDPGKLFIVGDARQSIYRFRRADVTVFRNMKSEKEGRGGLGVSLDVTYRTHEPLLLAAGEILASIMGTQPDPQRPYYEPFAPMQASRLEPLKDILPPHIEILIGLAEETKKSRPLSAELLVQRLLAFKEEGQIASWDEVALLFRSKTAYEEYEDALEAADIPFVTVAGRGFYSRPEIRDVLNILRALSDPADDLALAGLLRSPAFGVSDDGLYQLRFRGEEILAYRAALKENLDGLSPQDSQHAQRAGEFLAYFWPLVDRVPVADLLKQVVDWLNYRAILAAPEGGAASGRLWRNLDKLMRDAYKSQLVNVRDFLDYLKALDDVGAREGEAATEAEGAVSLMTIHASKGLEFKVVVLADASNDGSNSIDPVLLPSIGAAVKSEPTSLEFYLAKTIEKLEDETERNRLLYVALTRAEEKLIICGHANQREKLKSMGWLGDVLGALGANTEKFPQDELMDGDKLKENPCGLTAKLAIVTEETKPVQKKFEGTRGVPQQTNHAPIYRSLLREEPADVVDGKQADEPARGRVTGDAQAIDPLILGSMVHKAVELNLSLTDPTLNAVLETVALDRGLAEVKQKDHAITRARELLERLQSHPFWQQLSQAEEAHHEIPFSIFTAGRYQNGIIDLLYRTAGKWHVVDFKSDSIKNDGEKAKLINRYRLQVGAYCTAVQEQLGAAPAGHLCFLDDQGHVTIVDV